MQSLDSSWKPGNSPGSAPPIKKAALRRAAIKEETTGDYVNKVDVAVRYGIVAAPYLTLVLLIFRDKKGSAAKRFTSNDAWMHGCCNALFFLFGTSCMHVVIMTPTVGSIAY
jgi:hypothetical protein